MSNYVKPTVDKYSLPEALSQSEKTNVYDPLCVHIDNWVIKNGYSLTSKKLSGSRAKGTAITLSSDLDIFASLSSTTTTQLSVIFNSLYNYLNSQNIQCRKQNVSIGVVYNNKSVDIVPGRRQHQQGDDCSLWKNNQNTWTKTNISTHISTVRNSNRTIEIMATKIWRERHGLEFPSLFMELAVIEATKHRKYGDYDNNFLAVLEWLTSNIKTVRIVDPANSSNTISDDLTNAEKKAIADKATESRQKKSWSEIIW